MATDTLYLRQMELGPMQNFVYLIGDPETRDCIVVDPAWEIDAIVEQAQADGMRLNGVLVTHTHQDHVGGHLFGHDIPGVEELLAKTPAKVYVHAAEREFLRGFGSDLVKVTGGDDLDVGRVKVTFVHTPGHTPGSQCFLVDGRLISGDTLFIRSCGRTALPDETVVFPGHNYGGTATTIGEEKRQNPMMRFPSMTDFLRAMGRS